VTRVPVSIVIPAHDEANVIGRCLSILQRGAEVDELEIVVACNGCSDDTAAVALRSAPDAIVLELDVASKATALNAGDARATRFPRFYVDADIELDIHAVRATAAALHEDGVLCAAPLVMFDTAERPWYVRRFFDVLRRMPFLSGPGVVGTGVYALSDTGRARFAEFPDLTADDQFVMDRFAVSERRAVRSVHFVVHPPRDLANLLRTRQRTYRGNAELRAEHQPVADAAPGNGAALARLLADPTTAPGVPVYVAVNAVARYRARRARVGSWERDDSTR
jgi:glycosyltransferase involved in cell wall biosynthesis